MFLRKRDPNGPPKPYDLGAGVPLQALFPVGQEVLMNARKVESEIVDMQATAVWPKFTEIPEYEIQLRKLDEDLSIMHEVCKVEEMVPVNLEGLVLLRIWKELQCLRLCLK